MAEEISPCECVETAIHVVRNLDDARRLMRLRAVSRALIHAEFAKEKMPKLEKCLLIDLSEARRSLDKAREHQAEPEESRRWLERGWRFFMRTIRECAEHSYTKIQG